MEQRHWSPTPALRLPAGEIFKRHVHTQAEHTLPHDVCRCVNSSVSTAQIARRGRFKNARSSPSARPDRGQVEIYHLH
jgi:hypothetical protein